jgi:hypothetical protein
MMTYRMVRIHPTLDELPRVFGDRPSWLRLSGRMALVVTNLMNLRRPASCLPLVTLRDNGEPLFTKRTGRSSSTRTPEKHDTRPPALP